MVPVVLLGGSVGRIIDLSTKQGIGTENQLTVPKDSWQPRDSVEIGKKHSTKPIEDQDGCSKDAAGLDGHCHRTKKGTLRRKRGDAQLANIRSKDKLPFPWVIPPETELQILRVITHATGLHAVSEVLCQLEFCGQLRERLLQHGITPVKISPI